MKKDSIEIIDRIIVASDERMKNASEVSYDTVKDKYVPAIRVSRILNQQREGLK